MRPYILLISIVTLFSTCPTAFSEDLSKRDSFIHQVDLPQVVTTETSGDILLQANQYDINSITRSISGYSYGIDGFHKDIALARAWLKPLITLGEMEAYSISVLCVDIKDGRLKDNIGRSIAHCEMARNSSMAKNFRLFDVHRVCQELNNEKKNNNTWNDEYNLSKNIYKELNIKVNKVLELLRALLHRAANTKEQDIIGESINTMTLPILSSIIASDSLKNKNKKSSCIESILHFIYYQKEALKDKRANKKFISLVSFAFSTIIDKASLEDNMSRYAYIINEAHAGDRVAVRTVANYYLHGVSGFPQDRQLAQAWFQSGALEGDVLSMFFLATSYFEDGHLAPAWAFVQIIEDMKDVDIQTKAMVSQLKKVIEYSPDIGSIQEHGQAIAIDFFDQSEKRMDWRLQQEKNE